MMFKSNWNNRGGATLSWFIVGFSVLVVATYVLWRWNTQPVLTRVDAQLPDTFVTQNSNNNRFSHQSIEQLLQKFVHKGRVDYASWFDNDQALKRLDRYLAAVAKYSPENSPKRFKNKNERLVYWVNAYNAVVIKSILDNWPLSSVTDLKAPVEIIKGLGFFYKQKYIYGGQAYSLYQVENGKIFDGENDPRVHFILNCGSGSCPVLRPQIPTGEELEPFLAQAAREFVADSKNLHIADSERTIYLSTVFKWNKNDFKSYSSDNTLLGYVLSIAGDSLKKRLIGAKDYRIEFIEYDWSINEAGSTNEG